MPRDGRISGGGALMSAAIHLAVLIERWFTDRLTRHRGVSSSTFASYRDTFRLLFAFAQTRLGEDAESPSHGHSVFLQICAVRGAIA